MPRQLLAVLALFTAACGFAQEKKDEKKEDKQPANLYPLAKGSKWEYAAKSGGLDLEQEIEVTEVTEPKKGERAVATVTVTTGKYASAEKL